MSDLPEYYFRIRENGAAVFRVDTENRQRRIEMEQIAREALAAALRGSAATLSGADVVQPFPKCDSPGAGRSLIRFGTQIGGKGGNLPAAPPFGFVQGPVGVAEHLFRGWCVILGR